MEDHDRTLSRRQFAQKAALLSATASLAPAGVLLPAPAAAGQAPAQLPDNFPKLSAEGQAEAEARFQSLLSRYGSRLNDEEKSLARTACYLAQPSLERLRAFSLENGDVPALYLKPLVERDKKPSAAASKQAAATAQKP